jgi:hypothetical protein
MLRAQTSLHVMIIVFVGFELGHHGAQLFPARIGFAQQQQIVEDVNVGFG